MKKVFCMLFVLVCVGVFAGEIRLPKPLFQEKMTVAEALKARKSARDFRAGSVLTQQELSNLLWCANGFNGKAHRTAPSAVNAQAIEIYVFLKDGVYLYLPETQALRLVKTGDFRKMTGRQPFVEKAAVNLVYVYDVTKWPMGKTDGKCALADAMACAENVYLYCATVELKVVARGSFMEADLIRLLGLPPTKKVTLAQSVGR